MTTESPTCRPASTWVLTPSVIPVWIGTRTRGRAIAEDEHRRIESRRRAAISGRAAAAAPCPRPCRPAPPWRRATRPAAPWPAAAPWRALAARLRRHPGLPGALAACGLRAGCALAPVAPWPPAAGLAARGPGACGWRAAPAADAGRLGWLCA